jgi:hypothetical protein
MQEKKNEQSKQDFLNQIKSLEKKLSDSETALRNLNESQESSQRALRE